MRFSRIIKQELDKLSQELDDKYDINSGGCCWLAYLIAKHLDRLHISYSLIIKDDNVRDEGELEYLILNKIKSNEVIGRKGTCFHYAINIEGEGIVNDLDCIFDYSIHNITSANIKWLYRYGDWNMRYNIKYNHEVSNIVNSLFIYLCKQRKLNQLTCTTMHRW